MTRIPAKRRHSGRPEADPESSDFGFSGSQSVLPSFRKRRSRYPESSDFRSLVYAVILAIPIFASQPAAAADPFGRLFTTPQQRQKLDDLRRAELESPEIVVGPVTVETTGPAEKDAPLNPITVRGLVTREGGRSMAFINESNTYEGDLASEYIRVRSGDIEGEAIRLYTPYGSDAIALKVGQTLEPSTGRIIDLGEENQAPEAETPPVDPDSAPPPAPPNPANE